MCDTGDLIRLYLEIYLEKKLVKVLKSFASAGCGLKDVRLLILGYLAIILGYLATVKRYQWKMNYLPSPDSYRQATCISDLFKDLVATNAD